MVYVFKPREMAGKEETWGTRKDIITGETAPAKRVNMGIAIFNPNSALGDHWHETEEEILYVARGKGVIVVGGQKVDVEQGTIIYVPPNTKHAVDNTSDEILELIYLRSLV